MRLLLVINPVAGDRDKEPFLKKTRTLCRHYGIDLKILQTTGRDDAARLRAQTEDPTGLRVAVAGGDGTLNMAVSALLHRDIPVGFIPFGSANGMGREMAVASDPMQALRDLLLSSLWMPLDVLLVNDRYHCLHIGDVGFNANVVHAFQHDPSRGLPTYAKHFLKQVGDLETFGFTLRDGKSTWEREAVMVALCNGRTFGTGLPLNSESNPFDGRFEWVVVETVRVEAIVKAGLSTMMASLADNFDNEVIGATEATLSLDRPRPLQLDGEIVGSFAEVRVKVLPGAVPFITHDGNPYVSSPA